MIPQNSLKSNDYLSKFHKTKRNKIVNLYLDYVNNFLTLAGFSSYYGISENKANRIINSGRLINDKQSKNQ